jgi:predicted phage terminase large subunit-like protein
LLKDAQEASSPAIRKMVIDFYQRVALTRLTPDGAIVLIGTRWGKGDLFDHLLEEKGEDQWTVINFPAIAEENDPLIRAPGEALWPERYSVKHLAHKRYEMGASAFTCLYQGRPSEADGIIFRRAWFRTYTSVPTFKRVIMSADTAFKTTTSADFSCVQVWAEAQTGFYLLASWKQRVEFPDLVRTLIDFADQWKAELVLIEDAASGQSLLQTLQSSTSLPLKAIKADRDKATRANACTAMCESGRVYLPADAPWLGEYLDSLCGFPNMPHDDDVDATTQALNFLRGDGDAFGFLDWVAAGGQERTLDKILTKAVNVVKDVWGRVTPSPRDQNLDAKKMFPIEMKQRGIDPAKMNPATAAAWDLPKPGPCPACKSVCTILIGADEAKCNQCAKQWNPSGNVPEFLVSTRNGPAIKRRGWN